MKDVLDDVKDKAADLADKAKGNLPGKCVGARVSPNPSGGGPTRAQPWRENDMDHLGPQVADPATQARRNSSSPFGIA